jgi:hypothetical protein
VAAASERARHMMDLALVIHGEAVQCTVDERRPYYVAITSVCVGPRSDERKEK